MVYTDIQNVYGLDQPIDYGSGIEYASGILEMFPQIPALQIGLWLNGTEGCQDVVDGNLDAQIQRLFQYLTAECPVQRIFLRVGYEFDNPDFGYSSNPSVYRAAFQVLSNACRRHKGCYEKVDFVWHSWGASSEEEDLQKYYPGADYVDWVGVSLFTQFYENSTTGNLATVRAVLEFAKNVNHPVMIAESTPYGGIDQLQDPWMEWFQPVLDLIDEYDISMWSYIDCDWISQPMWKYAGFGDTRLSNNETVMEKWQQHVVDNPRFATGVNSLSSCQDRHKNNHAFPEQQLRLGDLTATSTSLVSPVYFLASFAIAFLVACFYWFCICQESAASTQVYAALPEDESEDEAHIEPKRTGYGTLAK
jgi:hypothetical protein